MGVNIMIAGLASQVASMSAFVFLCAQLAWRVWKNPDGEKSEYQELLRSSRFRFFLWGESTNKHTSPILIH